MFIWHLVTLFQCNQLFVFRIHSTVQSILYFVKVSCLYFIMTNADEINPSPKISRDLMRVAGVLQDMQDAGELQSMSLGVPPVAFVAGGPMWVVFSPLDLPRLLWLVKNMWLCSSRTLISTPNVLGFTRLKRFDESTITSRRGSQAATPPVAVKGIGGKGASKPLILLQPSIPNVESCTHTVAKPDYSDNKIVLAMVCGFFLLAWSMVSTAPGSSSCSESMVYGCINLLWVVLKCAWLIWLLQVGLPARGKSYLSNKLQIYLNVGLLFTDVIEILILGNHTVAWIRCEGRFWVPSLFLGLIFVPLCLKGVQCRSIKAHESAAAGCSVRPNSVFRFWSWDRCVEVA